MKLTRGERKVDNVSDCGDKLSPQSLTRTDAQSLRSQVGIGSVSDCMLIRLDRILKISDSEAGVKEKKLGGVVKDGKRGDDVVGLLKRLTKVGYFVCEEGSKDIGKRDTWNIGR